ncbi:DUF2232 domain-containing protein [Protofrankia symbiont of Coriaria ruscifolia]|uniref:DUF2232 domain-containing protein n=1 Tax=Protofrankia symbiont of Coriaria ruscifolia TaxID=1306542 RepID=UPI001F5ECDA0|nr:DUF2232 domain-containing protein [Protofrankia symbiont of Coriaria ruscifolia]
MLSDMPTAGSPPSGPPPTGVAAAPQPSRTPQARQRLRTVEIVEAALLVDLVIAICMVARFLPFGWVLTIAATVPAAALAARWRLRAALTAMVTALAVAVLIGGTGFAITIASCMMTGTLLGTAHRRRWGLVRTTVVGLTTLWAPVALGMNALFCVLTDLRALVLAEIVNSWDGARSSAIRLGVDPDGPGLGTADSIVQWGAAHWWALLPITLLANTAVNVLAAAAVTRPVLRRLAVGAPAARTDHPNAPMWTSTRRSAPAHQKPSPARQYPHPLPVHLESVTYRYPHVTQDALRDVSLTIRPAEFVAIVGGNGSGKSTLARIISGWSPTDGRVLRPGDCALGRTGGTAMIFQRPESQVLGVRVRDDVVWGLPDGGRTVDVETLLERVGLANVADRETATLSGGQLQRLAIAAALARAPRLLVSDESTAMVDAEGRDQLTDLLAQLPGEAGVAVVHVTHHAAEAYRAHRRIVLDAGRLTSAGDTPCGSAPRPPRTLPVPSHTAVPSLPSSAAPAIPAAPVSQTDPVDPAPVTSSIPARPVASVTSDGQRRTAGAPALVCLDGVGQVYSPRSPWARRALSGISFCLDSGEAVLIRGRNGSGKSTLAAVLAGLLSPSEGEAHLGGRPLTACPGEIGLAVQHSRLQLLAPTVGADVCAAAGVDAAAADEALAAVGLDPELFRDRRVEDLSGGQMRRAALAGLIACRPRLMILDEPLAGLDAPSRRILIDVLVNLRIRTGLTLVVVSHDLDGMACLTERMLVLDAGRLVHDGPFTDGTPCRMPALLPHPRPAGAATGAALPDGAVRPDSAVHPDSAVRIDDGCIGDGVRPDDAPRVDDGVRPDDAHVGDAHVGDAACPGSVPARKPVAVPPQSRPDTDRARRPAGGRGRFPRRRPAGRIRRTEPNLLRYIPGSSPVHRLWAGTKLVIMALLGMLIAVRPSWPVIGMVAGFVGISMIVARIPVGAAPRLPRWFWYGLMIGVVLTAQSHAAPFVTVGGVRLSVGGMLDWLRLTSVSMTMFAAAALLGWTTPLSELAPALSRLLAPLRRLRLPVDEWVATVALAIRCLPLLVDEIRTLLAVRRLRVGRRPGHRRMVGRLAALPLQARSTIELLCTAIVTCLRRAAEMTEAIVARGGFGAVAHQPAHPRRADAAALAALVGLAVATFLV